MLRPLVKSRFDVHSIVFMHVFISFFSWLNPRGIGSIDQHASEGNAVAGKIGSRPMNSEDPSLMASRLKEI